MSMIQHKLKRKFKLGVVINPFAGIGGALALKGSDGAEIREKALAAGAPQLAMQKAQTALKACLHLKDYVQIFTGAGDMGELSARALDFEYYVLGPSVLGHSVLGPSQSAANSQTDIKTEASDTHQLIQRLIYAKVDLILFVGGDGTARDVYHAMSKKLPVLGVPAGCKIHSGVYAITPKAAGKVLAQVINGELVSLIQGEVRDIDEALFRQGKVRAKHFGELWIPESLSYIQAVKMGGKESDELLLDDIAEYIREIMQDKQDHYFVMGSGSTVDAIMQYCGLQNTLLGVDVVKNGQVIKNDLSAQELIEICSNKPCKLVITLIGGQGHILGRGNQQLSPAFIRQLGKDNILLVATKTKIQSLGGKGLISDSGDSDLDSELSGPIKIITGYRDQVLYFVQDC